MTTKKTQTPNLTGDRALDNRISARFVAAQATRFGLDICAFDSWRSLADKFYALYADAGTTIIPRGQFGFTCDVDPADVQAAWMVAAALGRA